MVDKNDIVTTIPSSTSVTAVADGEVVSAAVENQNNQQLLQIATLLYQFVRDDCPSLGVTNTFTAEQIFNILKAQQIQPAITNGDLTLNPNGTGKIRYSDGSTDTEVASKGYVASVAFVAGNVPSGGTAGTWLEGDGSWSDPIPAGGTAGTWLEGDGTWSNPSPTTVQRSTSTSALSFVPANTVNVIDSSAGSITHYLPDSPISTQKLIKFLVDGVNSWEANNWTLNGNGNNIIVVNADGSVEAAAATVTISSNISFGVWFNGTQYVMERGI